MNAIAAVFGGVSGGTGVDGKIFSGISNAVAAWHVQPNKGGAQPTAGLNYILFDKNYKVLDMGYQAVPGTANTLNHLVMSTVNISEPGYLFAYVDNEDSTSTNYVYFDDFNVKVTPTQVLQYNEYYPFGMQTGNSWTRGGTTNNFLYNEGSELNKSSGWYDLPARNYDPVLGKFFQVDPLAATSHNLSPYHYAGNNPISFTDPSGLKAIDRKSEDFWAKMDAQLNGTYFSDSRWGFDYSKLITGGLTYGQMLIDAAKVNNGEMDPEEYARKWGQAGDGWGNASLAYYVTSIKDGKFFTRYFTDEGAKNAYRDSFVDTNGFGNWFHGAYLFSAGTEDHESINSKYGLSFFALYASYPIIGLPEAGTNLQQANYIVNRMKSKHPDLEDIETPLPYRDRNMRALGYSVSIMPNHGPPSTLQGRFVDESKWDPKENVYPNPGRLTSNYSASQVVIDTGEGFISYTIFFQKYPPQ